MQKMIDVKTGLLTDDDESKYTDAERLNWHPKGHADAIPDLVDRLTDLKTMLIQLRARLPSPRQLMLRCMKTQRN